MSVWKIAWRSIQHRGLGSLLTVISMALGVMMVVAVLTIHGVISSFFQSNNSFGYNVIIGGRSGGTQLTMTAVYYLNSRVETIPYEYYLAFQPREVRESQIKNSIAFRTHQMQQQMLELDGQLSALSPLGGGPTLLAHQLARESLAEIEIDQMEITKDGWLRNYSEMAIPLCLGDYFHEFRAVGTTPEFFTELMLDLDTEEKIEFAEGRPFEHINSEHGYFECVVGSTVARQKNVKLGDLINPTHGAPDGHTHEQGFSVVGIMKPTGTPHDRAVFINMEGFFLMEDHAKPVAEETLLKSRRESGGDSEPAEIDEFDRDDDVRWSPKSPRVVTTPVAFQESEDPQDLVPYHLQRDPLPLEQREITAILLRTNRTNDSVGLLGNMLVDQISGGGFLEPTLDWSNFRPEGAQTAAEAVNPISEVTNVFQNFIDPIQFVLLFLTIMICLVSGIAILVGMYNSMNQRRHEISVVRALGASRTKVMAIMLAESVMLALAGGFIGWICGHALNAALSPYVEAQTGVSIGFFDFAPPVPVFQYLFSSSGSWADALEYVKLSPEFLLIPGLILLAILVGIYPAISAYRTDVAKSLGS